MRDIEKLITKRAVGELFVTILSMLVLLLALASLAEAAGCRNGRCAVKVQQKQQAVKVVKQQVVAQPVVAQVAYPPVYYAVAPHLQDRSMIRHEIREALRELINEERSAMNDELRNQCDTCPPLIAQRSSLSAQTSVLSSSCAKCHGGESPKAGFSVDVELNDTDRAKIARKVLSDQMPLGADGEPAPLSNEAKSQLLVELFSTQEGE